MNSTLVANKRHSPIVFIRGFNSYPNEELRFGPMNFGLVHRHLQPEFEKRGYHFVPLYRMGYGSVEEQIERAREQILSLRLGEKLHLLGHSTGGVIARGVAHSLKESHRILSVVTIVSPHRGSSLADQADKFSVNHPFWFRFWKSTGYDVTARVPLLEPLKVQSMLKFNETYPNLDGVRYASIVSGGPRKSLPLFLQMIAQFAADPGLETDGIVEKTSQLWGETLGEFTVDHGAIIGFRTMLSPRTYRRTHAEFLSAIEKIDHFCDRTESFQ